MSSINLKNYQTLAVNQLVYGIKKAFEIGKNELNVVFDSPTGSGKTTMMAKSIELLVSEIGQTQDICFLWLSIGKGGLHKQSQKSLLRILGAFPKVSLIEDEYRGVKKVIDRNSVVVSNWEKLVNRDRVSGDWSNKLMKDGEFINFREVISNTRQVGRKIVLIVDESHQSTGLRATELRELIHPDIIIEMSATPNMIQDDTFTVSTNIKFDEESGESAGSLMDIAFPVIHKDTKNLHIKIHSEVVIAEEIIKKEIIINAGLSEIMDDEMDSLGVILESAYRKREELAKLYKKAGSRVNPLVLVQIPNKDEGDVRREQVETFLQTKKINQKSGKLKVWLSEDKSEFLEYIANKDDETEYLIFKQSVATGWDCPRSHIWVKLRDTRSRVFEIQTLGRILRTPEQKHYEYEELNTGYVYTNQQDYSLKTEEYGANLVKTHRSLRDDKKYKNLGLDTYHQKRVDYGDIKADFQDVFRTYLIDKFGFKIGEGDRNIEKFAEYGVSFDLKNINDHLAENINIHTLDIDEHSGEIIPNTFIDLKISGGDLDIRTDLFIKGCLGNFGNFARSKRTVRQAIYAIFDDFFDSRLWIDSRYKIQIIFIKHIHLFKPLLVDVVSLYEQHRKIKQATKSVEIVTGFEIPKELYFSDLYAVREFPKSIHAPCFLLKEENQSKPETNFIKLISRSKKVLWWWKNGESREVFLGLRYVYLGETHTFYPDFVVCFQDGRVGIFETKDKNDQDGSTKTKAKSEVLYTKIQKWKYQGKKVFGGVCVELDTGWIVNQKETYNFPIISNEWDNLEEIVS